MTDSTAEHMAEVWTKQDEQNEIIASNAGMIQDGEVKLGVWVSNTQLLIALYALQAYNQQGTMRGATLVNRIINLVVNLPSGFEDHMALQWAIEEELERRGVEYLR